MMPEYGSDNPYRRSVGERITDGLILGACMSLVLVLMLIAATYALGNKQQRALEDIPNATRAQVCVLALPVTDKGRDPADVDACLSNNGIVP